MCLGFPFPQLTLFFLLSCGSISWWESVVVAGAMAMLSPKGRGRHSSFGTIYYWCLMVVVAAATGLSVVRWADNYHLFFLGTLS